MKNNQYDPELITEKIISILRKYPRDTNCHHLDIKHCFFPHTLKIQNLVQLKLPITFVLPAFPAKSPNAEKTGGILPDLGEHLSLSLLNGICERIQKIYPIGAKIIICSDGRVFNDLVRVTDNDVNAYSAGIKKIIKKEKLRFLSTFSLDDRYHDLNYAAMRNAIIQEHGEDLSVIKKRVKSNEESKLLFNGIHRFIFEDQLVNITSLSKNQIRCQSKEIAYQVIQRSNAWSHLLQIKFPNAIRLSIHPQPCGSEKLGIMLLESTDIWATPWHRVVLKKMNRYQLIRKKEAELLKARPVFIDNQFSHYML